MTTLARLRRQFIRPSHELSDEFDYAKSMAGTKVAPWWCFKCLVHAVVNNVCQSCGRDERVRHGDFERDVALEEWEQVRANLSRPINVRTTSQRVSEKLRTYWRRKQRESRKRRNVAPQT